ncbi:hypothetical protein SO802_024838 [Lithocarpus litseifolius]|uniref:Transposase, Ptta/En/Spm, plant n=1 Tax=Lithocarpus litseifolius TaxID=425828 RepID=A0AAW2CA35_9ROSI
MGRKRRLQYVEPGESSSHVGSNEVPSREQAPLANDDRRQSQGSDDETQAPDTEDIPVPAAGAVVVPNKRGPNRFDDIWNMPPGKKLFLKINKAGQPVGENAGPWAKWLGTVARKPDMCPINYRSWHKMPRQYKTRCWETTQARWVIPTDRIPLADQRKWVLSRIGKLWRSHKTDLKKKHCKLDTTKEELLQLSLPEVDDAQFHALVEYWFTDDFKDLSRDNKVRRGKQTEMHTLGSRSMARTADSIAKERGKQLERGELYEVAYSHRDGTAVNATAQANIAKMKELMTEGSQLQGNDIEAGILWQPDDAFGQVIGAERGGRVRGVGFGPTPSSNRARTMDDSMPSPTSIATDQRVIELSTQVEAMKEKCARYDAEMRLMRKVLTSLCPSFPSMSMVEERRVACGCGHEKACGFGHTWIEDSTAEIGKDNTDDFGDDDSAVDIQSPGAQHLSFDDTQ